LSLALVFAQTLVISEGEVRLTGFRFLEVDIVMLGYVGTLHIVDQEGRYDGLALSEALPLVVDEIVAAFSPFEVILFGSVARGEDGPDSDLDLLVVFEKAERSERRQLTRDVRSAIKTFVPVDVVILDRTDLATFDGNVGSPLYWPLREGRSVYKRADKLVA
jgi:uncharacterized protein